MIYGYKPNARIRAPAQIAGEVCEQLASSGQLTPMNLVNASRPENAPLHNEFEWNDTAAAEAYREVQGRHIINCLVIVSEPATEQQPTRAFVRVTEERKEYTPIKVVCESNDLMDALLQEARKEMECFIRKYNGLKGLSAVINDMQAALGTTE